MDICKKLKTDDNGPPWNSEEFKKFAKYLGFRHPNNFPLRQRANGMIEKFLYSLRKVTKTSNIENKCWKQEMNGFHHAFRNTPHSTMNQTPAEFLSHRQTKLALPQLDEQPNNDTVGLLRSTDVANKQKNSRITLSLTTTIEPNTTNYPL